MPTRRQFLKASILTAIAAPPATVAYTLFVEPHWLQITRPRLGIAGLPPELKGTTIAQLSDLHIGNRVSDKYIIESFRHVHAQRPDIVALTGDLISYDSSEQLTQLARVLEHVPHGTRATVGTLGNHDYGHAWRMMDVADRVADVARNAGITLLRNEQIDVGGLKIFGADDFWTPAFDPDSVREANRTNPAHIVLSHNPDTADIDMWDGFNGWILAGHTHGGQCKPPFLPPPMLPVRNRRYTSGKFELANGDMYISRGVGHLLKARFNARPEVPIFTLEQG